MTALRKLLPWMAALLLHAILALAADSSLLAAGPGAAAPRAVTIVLESAGAGGERAAASPAARNRPPAAAPRKPSPAAPAPRLPARPPKAPAAPRSAEPAAAERVPVMGAPQDAEPLGPEDSPPEAAAAMGGPEVVGVDAAPGGGSVTALMDQVAGQPRKLLQRQAVVFPRVLSASGQEADCTARITVNPRGVVTHVEITGRSGYTEVDTSAATALRGYLFSEYYGYGNGTTVLIVRFKFRLGRMD
jgi:outer membrane biosynthesis protein TonB